MNHGSGSVWCLLDSEGVRVCDGFGTSESATRLEGAALVVAARNTMRSLSEGARHGPGERGTASGDIALVCVCSGSRPWPQARYVRR